MPVPVPSERLPISFPSWKRHLSSHVSGHRGEEGAKAVASALARLTELKELTLSMEPGEKIGPGPRRAPCSDPEEVEARELQLHGTADHCALSLSATRGRSVAAWGLTSLSPEVMQAPQLWLRACGICDSSLTSELICAATRSARGLGGS